MSKLTPMMQQYRQIKERFPEEFLFFRMGDFYEMFFDDALKASEILEITLTARDGGGGSKVPMCGVPYHAAEGYINRLVSRGHKVAICEQLEDPAQAKGVVRRDVVRVITPGTLLEEGFLREKDNNYIVALAADGNHLGLSCADISTGYFGATALNTLMGLSNLSDELSRLSPAEIVVDLALEDREVLDVIRQNTTVITRRALEQRARHEARFEDLAGPQADLFSPAGRAAKKAGATLLDYLEDTQKQGLENIQSMDLYRLEHYMYIDRQTRRNLELTRSLRSEDQKVSLVATLDYTATAMGGRRLKRWLEQPLIDREVIRDRQDAVEELVDNIFLREDLRRQLREVYDLERILTRVALNRANARDLLALGRSLRAADGVRQTLLDTGAYLQSRGAQMTIPPELLVLLESAIHHEPPLSLKDGGLIRDGYHEEIDRLRAISTQGRGWIGDMEETERERTGIRNLKVGYNRVFGYYLEVTRSHAEKVPEHFIRKQTLANAERYITPELKELEEQVLGASDRLVRREYEVFCGVREEAAAYTKPVQTLARQLSELDALLSFSEAAVRNGYVRPEIDDSADLALEQGRHPVVECLLTEEPFVPNDCQLSGDGRSLAVITGPNMAGKSTYIRMVAVLTVMAQAGSFVPAAQMRLGLVDRIFARVGASDDLATGQSTFMVEMNEVSNIMRNATGKSLIILDEVGRGTSTLDGLAIAWSISEYIHSVIGARTLFATHYHELVALEEIYEGIFNLSMAVREREEDVVFLRQVVAGGADRSYGIHVAQMAGLPKPVLKRAREKMSELEQGEQIRTVREKGQQMSLVRESPVEDLLRQASLDDFTPRQALDFLYEMKRLSGDGEETDA